MRQSTGRPGVANWAQVAQFVRVAMASPPSPSIEAAVGRVPPHWLDPHNKGLDRPKPQSVRRWITALKNLEKIENDTAEEWVADFKKLRDAPVAAVELICRWQKFDHVQALNAAQKVVQGEWRIERLRKEYTDARKSTTGRGSGRQYAYKLRQRLTDWAVLQFGADFALVKDRNGDDPPVDVMFKSKSDPRQLVSVLVFGPYTNREEYESRRTAFLSLLAGVALYMKRVLAIMPDQGPDYWRWLHDHNVDGANIEIFAVNHQGRDFSPIKLSPPLLQGNRVKRSVTKA
jgi:hypothetical protein